MSTSSRPRRQRRDRRVERALRHSASTPSPTSVARYADAQAADVAGERGRVVGAPARARRRVGGSCPGDHLQAASAASATVWRTGRSGRATTQTRAARTATRARMSASSRRDRRTPPAGGSSRRCPSRARAGAIPAATAAAEPPLLAAGVRVGSHGLRVGPKAEFSVDEPIANSSRFVLPTMTAPAASQARDDGRGVRRHVALAGCATRRWSGHPPCKCCP